MLLLLFIGQQPVPSQPGFANLALAVADLWAPLNAAGPADAVFWSEAQLFAWMDEAGKRLAGKRGPFVVRDASIETAAGDGVYDLPSAHIATVQADLAGRVLRPRTVAELEAVDSDWPDTEGTPGAFVQDLEGLGKLALYPKPTVAPETLGLVIARLPDVIAAGSAIVAVPPVMREYFTFSALAEARAAESRGSMDEVAEWLRAGVVDLYVQAAGEYWGIQ